MKKPLQITLVFLILMSVCAGCHINEVSDQELTNNEVETKSDNKIYQSGNTDAQSSDKTKTGMQMQTNTDWVNNYIDILCGRDFICEKYALIFVSEDDIPVLLGNNPDSYYQICRSLSDGTITYYDKLPYGTYSREYYYLPGQNSIVSTCTGENGRGLYEEYYTLEKKALEYNLIIGKVPKINDTGNLLCDEEGNYIWYYEKNGEKLRKKNGARCRR